MFENKDYMFLHKVSRRKQTKFLKIKIGLKVIKQD